MLIFKVCKKFRRVRGPSQEECISSSNGNCAPRQKHTVNPRSRISLVLPIILLAGMVPAAFAQELPPPEWTENEPAKMDSHLVDLYEAALGGGAPMTRSPLPINNDTQRVQVILEMVSEDAPVPQNLGIEVETLYQNLVQASVPIRNLEVIASDHNILEVRLPSRPVHDVVLPPAGGKMPGEGFDLTYLLIPAVALPAAAAVLAWKRRSDK